MVGFFVRSDQIPKRKRSFRIFRGGRNNTSILSEREIGNIFNKIGILESPFRMVDVFA